MAKKRKTKLISSPFPAPIKPPKVTLAAMVRAAVDNYLQHIDNEPESELYDQVIGEVESSLLHTVLEYTEYNQSEAAEILGINRGTLRTKMAMYGFL